MPVINPQQPTVQVSVPVPTPVAAPKPRAKPVQPVPQGGTAPALPQAPAGFAPQVPPMEPPLAAIILPHQPAAKRPARSAQPQQMRRVRIVKRYAKVPQSRRKYAMPGLSGGPVTISPRFTSSVRADPQETIQQNLAASRRQTAGNGTDYMQNTTAGGVLADALDETGMPHAPFFRNLVPTGGLNFFQTRKGTYSPRLGGGAHPVRGDGVDAEGTRWHIRPANTHNGPSGVLVHRDMPSNATSLGASHTALMHAPDLREWAAHPQVGPSLRAALTNAADHLESEAARVPVKTPDQIDQNKTKLRRVKLRHSDGINMARKRDTDPRAREQELRSWIESVKPSWVRTGWDQDRGDIYEHVSDDAARLAFADWIREVTGNPNDPRATVVQNHNTNPKTIPGVPNAGLGDTRGFLYDVGGWNASAPSRPYEYTKARRHNGLHVQGLTPDYHTSYGPKAKATHAMVRWKVALPPQRDSTGRAKPGRRAEFHEFHAVLKPNQLHDLIDQLPPEHQKPWRDYANQFGLADTRGQAEPPAQMRRVKLRHRDGIRRYSMAYTHNDFHARIKESPNESTVHGAYADWLSENRMPATGEAISKGLIQNPTGESEPVQHLELDLSKDHIPWHTGNYGMPDFWVSDFLTKLRSPNSDKITFNVRDRTSNNKFFRYVLGLNPGEGLELMNRMQQEGVALPAFVDNWINELFNAPKPKPKGKKKKYARTIPSTDPEFRNWWSQLTGRRNATIPGGGSEFDPKTYRPQVQMTGVSFPTAAPFEDWLREQGDWRHWLIRGLANLRTVHVSSRPIEFRSTYIRPDRGRGGTEVSADLVWHQTRGGVVSHDATLADRPYAGPHTKVYFTYNKADKPVVYAETWHPNKKNQQVAAAPSILTLGEYAAMRHEAASAGIHFPEPPTKHAAEPEID